MSPHANSPRFDPGSASIFTTPQQEFNDWGLDEAGDVSPPSNHSRLRHTPENELHDLVCVGFGPASLAIAVALHDALDEQEQPAELQGLRGRAPKVAFLERQHQFAWHAGMLLPGAKMQISFIKDMATLRNPKSEFTFINYLHQNNRLVEFTNLNTFLPARIEYEDYMRWCAGWFEDVVEYNQEVVKVVPEKSSSGKISSFVVQSKDTKTGQIQARRTKHVVIAAGGRPNIPKPFPQKHPKVIHSSQFNHLSHTVLKDSQYPYNIAVVGSGQSAAEIFDFIHSHYPNARTNLLIKGSALRPSDDSPFVNEIFNPERIDCTFSRAPELRAVTIKEDKATNYGVVRLELLERIYETLYTQRIRYGNSHEAQNEWPHRILPYRTVTAVDSSPVIPDGVRLHVQDASPLYFSTSSVNVVEDETLDVDAVFVATGYQRDLHEILLGDARDLMPGGELKDRRFEVARDYRVLFENGRISDDAGVWLQGCCERSHGLSDTLLSVLATRGGQMVGSIFGNHHRVDSVTA